LIDLGPYPARGKSPFLVIGHHHNMGKHIDG
jgi:hypothetical protein